MPLAVVAAAVSVAAGSAIQALTALGFGLVASPFLIALLGPHEGLRTAFLLAGALNILVLIPERHHVDLRPASVLLASSLLATPFIALGVKRLEASTLAIVAGTLTILAGIALASGWRSEALKGRLGGMLAGITSAAMNITAGIGGPAAVMYLTNVRSPEESLRPTLQVYFLAMNAVAIASLGFPRFRPGLVLALVAGWLGGALLRRRIPLAAAVHARTVLIMSGGTLAISRGAGWL